MDKNTFFTPVVKNNTSNKIFRFRTMSLEWFTTYLNNFIKERAKIIERIDGLNFVYELDYKGRLPVTLFKITTKEKQTKDYFHKNYKGLSLEYCKEIYGYGYSNAIVFLGLFGILHREFYAEANNLESLFDVPYKVDFNKNDDNLYHQYVMEFVSTPKMGDDLVTEAFYHIFIKEMEKRSFAYKKFPISKEYSTIIDKHKLYNKKDAKVFRKFVEIVYNFIKKKEANTSEESAIKNSKITSHKERDYSPNDMLTSEQAAEYIDAPISRIYSLTHYKQILFKKPGGGKLWIKRTELDEYLNGNRRRKFQYQTDKAAVDIVFARK